MRTLFKNGRVINVFTDRVEETGVLMENDRIIGLDDYDDSEAERVVDLSGKFLCPGFIDGHIHIESTMMTPAELARACMPHGTTAIVADPHEIANVCGVSGIAYMLEASRGLPMHVYIMLPSCVPSTPFDESGATLEARDLEIFYSNRRVLGLAEVMNYPGVLARDGGIMEKLAGAAAQGRVVDGHAPTLTGKPLDRYISAGIHSDHECSSAAEALERVRKGQWVMIRQGTAARDLAALLPLFDEPYSRRCLLAADDRHPSDILRDGHIDNIVRLAIANGKSPISAIRMATLQAAQCFGLQYVGAVAPGCRADMLVLDDLEGVVVRDVYSAGVRVVKDGKMAPVSPPRVREELQKAVLNSFYLAPLRPEDFHLEARTEKCRVIRVLPGQLLTEEWVAPIRWESGNGVDTERDILKLAVVERHMHTGHRGVGFINGVGLKRGAIASSVSHDSHNLIIIGANDSDMAAAANRVRALGGGCAVVADGEVLADMPLPIAGLMTDSPAKEIALANERLRETVYSLGVHKNVEPFMNMAFVSLTVIPSLKMTTLGLVDTDKQTRAELYVAD